MSSAMIIVLERVGLPLDEEWLVSLEQELAETNWEPWRTDHASIFRVPDHIRDDDDANLYDPKVVSLGPYHRHVDRLLPMNRIKRHSLKKFLGRSTSYALVDYLHLIKVSECRACAAYDDDLAFIGSRDFIKMMLLDDGNGYLASVFEEANSHNKRQWNQCLPILRPATISGIREGIIVQISIEL
ncbi:hypothetical protein ZIOFF_046110 [Zingiber officinale]|uniref:Uncharacterized protein n=1 Tax=Zingiber officinale TaxID=94328 RepID=A0A8J5FZP1_ZINOF|nr:hypothetical protein ZIOFF_046110 [Zingiber officinale]